MILFPLMSGWIWLQIFTASPFLSSERAVADSRSDDILSSSVPFDGDRT